MKILMTGFTAPQNNSLRQPIQKINVLRAVRDGFRKLGHEVEWRKTKLGEDLSSFDLTWVSLFGPNSLNGRLGTMGALWALSHTDIPSIRYWDDWQVRETRSGFKTVGTRSDFFFYKNLETENYFATDLDLVRSHHDRLTTAINALWQPWERGLGVAPMYDVGEPMKVIHEMPHGLGRLMNIDPSAVCVDLRTRDCEDVPDFMKLERWALAALISHDEWAEKLGCEWPIDYFGNQNMIKRKKGKRLQTENDVREAYAERWGIISPKYHHAGSGWWRSRYIYAALVGSVMYCDEEDAQVWGDGYYKSIAEIEAMDSHELAMHVDHQRQLVLNQLPTEQDFLNRLEAIIERAQECA